MALCGTGYGKGPPRSTLSTAAVLLPVRGTERDLLVRLRRILQFSTISRTGKSSRDCRAMAFSCVYTEEDRAENRALGHSAGASQSRAG